MPAVVAHDELQTLEANRDMLAEFTRVGALPQDCDSSEAFHNNTGRLDQGLAVATKPVTLPVTLYGNVFVRDIASLRQEVED
jgi:hypothetical protein